MKERKMKREREGRNGKGKGRIGKLLYHDGFLICRQENEITWEWVSVRAGLNLKLHGGRGTERVTFRGSPGLAPTHL